MESLRRESVIQVSNSGGRAHRVIQMQVTLGHERGGSQERESNPLLSHQARDHSVHSSTEFRETGLRCRCQMAQPEVHWSSPQWQEVNDASAETLSPEGDARTWAPVTAPGQAFSKGFTLGGTKSADTA